MLARVSRLLTCNIENEMYSLYEKEEIYVREWAAIAKQHLRYVIIL